MDQAAVRQIFTNFIENCQKIYIVSVYVIIDEKLEKFRGWCFFISTYPTNQQSIEMKS